MTVSVRADDGAGHPAATSLAQQLYSPGNPAGAWETHNPVSFTTPATLTSGKIYYVVFTNTSTTNYISVNSVFSYAPTTPRQPLFADSEYGLMYTTGAWGSVHRSYTPVIDLAYVNGIHDGQSYYEAMIANYATISGTGSMARERFTVAGGNKTVASAAVRVRRSAGTSPLVMTLETSAGVAIESVSVPATSVPVSAPGGANGGAVWVKANFRSPRILANGATYNLRISTAAGTTYTTFPVRQGTSKGFATYAFTSGSGQKTTNGSTWADLYAYDQQDLQFYFTLATPPITPTTTAPAPTTTTTTTTPAPTTTTTTPAPTVTTTTPALASSLQCPVVASPKVGQTVTCTYR
jgi:hypothetical protein